MLFFQNCDYPSRKQIEKHKSIVTEHFKNIRPIKYEIPKQQKDQYAQYPFYIYKKEQRRNHQIKLFLNPDRPKNFKYAAGFVDFCKDIRKKENVIKKGVFPSVIYFKRNIQKRQKHIVKKQSETQNEIVQRKNPQNPSNIKILYRESIPDFCTINQSNNQKSA